jgi:DNA-binding MarR family transcriptional regulator
MPVRSESKASAARSANGAGAASGCVALRDPQRVEELLLYRVNRFYAAAGAMVVRVCEGQFGITRREWRLIAWLADAGELSPSALAERASLDRARTSRAISSLVTKGLALRQVVASDRRLATVKLSARGRALHAQLMPRVAGINRALLAPLGDADVARLDHLLERLQARAAELLASEDWPKAQRRRGRRAAD